MSECKQSTDENLPFVSIIIPVRNEEKFIESTLMACLKQDYPEDRMEIIVVDGISTDKTGMILREMSENDHRIKLAKNEKKITPVSLNIGIKESKGDILVIVGGHSEINEHFIRSAVTKLNCYKDVWGVGGPIKTIGETFSSRAISLAMSSIFGVGNSAFRTLQNKECFVDTIPFPAYHRFVYEKIGLYDETLVRNQDDEFNLRIIEQGKKLLLSPTMESAYFSRLTIVGLLKQYFQYGFYKVRVIQKHPKIFRIRHFVPGIFVFCLLCSPFLFFIPYGRLLSYSLYFSYIFSNLFFSFYTCLKNKFWGLFHLSLAFLCLHLGYGSGFICGLIHFNFRRKNGK